MDRPYEDLKAGDDFRNSLIERADSYHAAAPLWHGWALMDSFLAGLDHARASDRALIEKLVGALKPFAEAADVYEKTAKEVEEKFNLIPVMTDKEAFALGECRKAREALSLAEFRLGSEGGRE